MASIRRALSGGLKGAQRLGTAIAPHIQRFGNALGPYVLGNIGAAAALYSGVEHADQLWHLPDGLENALFYSGLGAFNAGVLVPAVRSGPVNYARSLFSRKEDGGLTLRPHGKSLLLLAALGFGVANDSIRDSSALALEKIASDVATVVHTSANDGGVLPPAPVPGPQPGPSPAEDLGDPKLEAAITTYVNGLRKEGFARARGIEDYSIYVRDLHDGNILVDINTHIPRLAASTNKVYVLLAAETLIAQGKLEDTEQLEKNLKAMISKSNNFSTDWVIDQVGGEQTVNNIAHSYGFPDTTIEKINPRLTGGRTLGNKTSAQDLGTFFEHLYASTFPRSAEMKDIFSLEASGHPDRLVDRTCIPDDPKFLTTSGGYVDEVLDKTGFIWGANNDSGYVRAHFFNHAKNQTTDVPYVITVLIQDPLASIDDFLGSSARWGREKSETLRTISESIFWDGLERKYSDIKPSCKAHKGDHLE